MKDARARLNDIIDGLFGIALPELFLTRHTRRSCGVLCRRLLATRRDFLLSSFLQRSGLHLRHFRVSRRVQCLAWRTSDVRHLQGALRRNCLFVPLKIKHPSNSATFEALVKCLPVGTWRFLKLGATINSPPSTCMAVWQ